ncbi:MAG: DNA-3-methyladenine glycosylase, partial [Bacteroidota bacterium]
LTRELYGLRVVGVPDLFEALSWAILGQQVNLSFAYSMKARLIEKYGSYLEYEGRKFWAFPNPKTISKAHIDTLKSLSISQRKAEYLIEVAQQLVRGSFSKSSLLDLGKADLIEKELCKIRGIGPWTAHYVMLRCLRIPQAYPVGDAGLQNAVKQRLQMDRKPSYDELYSLAENWKGWEAYATFYLWNGLNKT